MNYFRFVRRFLVNANFILMIYRTFKDQGELWCRRTLNSTMYNYWQFSLSAVFAWITAVCFIVSILNYSSRFWKLFRIIERIQQKYIYNTSTPNLFAIEEKSIYFAIIKEIPSSSLSAWIRSVLLGHLSSGPISNYSIESQPIQTNKIRYNRN